ncbi:GntR family transcriptional regulator [Lentilactobacillus parafarraginis]|jgi:DNA-binding GntR family transcriptional regulator|uniref:UbiC transcription regulator-associated domain protein n=3 Tax=Lentilactobacillus parafarraginis TaxID=390842 RepID=A0A0R1YRK4_9LACO|nr:GntR family transcriptional regulator [Lentilactobacillus parafarraginis]EHL98441.1 UbiC transcription regulator-associated domain protein [Lentilactobacillus parafarraginis F0439]KRM41891.1 UbiC transcription regulator-associated domain protein [Lentilactobacillus parafarraginis DSM 18390 = JCM 14109]TLQ19770.1 GntR family transcriptional regulator [Lentilactobacillus parafarraginis]
MADLVYQNIMKDLKDRIKKNEFDSKRLPDERSLSESYGVSRSSVKRALNVLANQGIIFKKRGSGTFINPLFQKNRSIFQYEGSNLGVTDSFKSNGEVPKIKLLDFNVIPASDELQTELFLDPGEFVYEIKRLRTFEDKPFMIELGYIPIRVAPELNKERVEGSIFNYFEDTTGKAVTKSFMTITTEPSTGEDQKLLNLKPVEPVGVMEGIFFLDDGTPFEVSNMRLHYKYLNYNTFVDLNENR